MLMQDGLPLTRENIASLKQRQVSDRNRMKVNASINRQKQIDAGIQKANGDWTGKHRGAISNTVCAKAKITHAQRRARVVAKSIAADPKNKK